MPRAAVPLSIQTEVLVESRRRCCICFGLNRDTKLKRGQIAHLDRDSSNSAKDNLAFLCFEHHDLYDSETSQSKNLTTQEVKRYKAELHRALGMAFDREVQFGEAASSANPIAGHYVLESLNESADLRIKRLDDGTFRVQGTALWGTHRDHGPNIGELDFISRLEDGALVFSEQHQDGRVYRARLEFSEQGLTVVEENRSGRFGLNTSFAGTYART